MRIHSSNNTKEAPIIVTIREALSIFGMRRSSLRHLERAAKIPSPSKRIGYTVTEMEILLMTAKKALQK